MIVQRLETPVSAVVDLDEMRLHVRTDPNDSAADRELALMADAAVREAEEFGQIALLAQRVRVTLESCPRASTIPLPIAPLLDWSTVEVTSDGIAFDDFSVTTGQRPAIRFAGSRPSGSVVIEYLAGWGETADSIPEDLRMAILDQAAAFFDARGPGDGKTVARSPHFARIVGRYRRVRV